MAAADARFFVSLRLLLTRGNSVSGLATAASTGPRFGTSFLPRPTIRIHSTMNQASIGYNPKARSISIRCEQSTKEGSGLDVWLGRLAMVGFAAALTVEIATGKGLLENFGLTEPLPTAALAVTALAGVVTAVFIFQSSSNK